jgi:hypothetical protein
VGNEEDEQPSGIFFQLLCSSVAGKRFGIAHVFDRSEIIIGVGLGGSLPGFAGLAMKRG